MQTRQQVTPRWPVSWRLSLTLLLLLAAPVLGQAAPLVWVAPSTTRVAPTAAAQSQHDITLSAARGEYESFQVIVRGPAGGLTNVNVTAPDLAGPNGATIPRANLTLYREHYLHITVPSPDWHGGNRPLGTGWYPDGLIPFADPRTGADLKGAALDAVPFPLAEGKNQPVWVDVSVPRDATAGSYTGDFTVTSDQGSVSVTLTLIVWDFSLPRQPFLQSCFGNHADSVDELLRNRIMPRALDPAEERTLIDTAGLNVGNSNFWSGGGVDHCSMTPAPSVAEFEAAAALHQPDIPLYAYIADEIGSCTNLYNTIKQWARNMHQTRIQNLITMSPVPELYTDGTSSGRSAVDIWVMLPVMYDEHAANVADVLAKGDQVWSYNCLVQDSYSPKWEVDFAPINFRLQPGFLNQSMDLTGLLYWRVDTWTSDPWNDVNTYYGGYPGEGVLVYPGSTVGLPGRVAPSMRLKYLRDGVDDYDYIEMLKRGGFGEWAMSVVRGLAPDWTRWTRDPAAVEAARQQFGPVLARTFRDVPASNWAFKQILACREAGFVKGYDDGTYRPTKVVTRDQMAVYIARGLAGGEKNVPDGPEVPTFSDVATDFWAYKYIEYAVSQGVVTGFKEDNTYRPGKPVTRAQMAAFIARSICTPTGEAGMASYQPPDRPTFRDIGPDDWGYNYVEYLAEKGVVTGYSSNDTYRPNNEVTRDQMAVYLARAYELPLPTDLSALAQLGP